MKSYEKGAIGEHRVVADLINKGHRVHKPLLDSLPYDLVVSIKGFFYKIQVKYLHMVDGCIESSPRIVKGKEKVVSNIEFDILAIFCPDTDTCYYIHKSQFIHSVRLRMTATKNNQAKNVRFAKDYIEIKTYEDR